MPAETKVVDLARDRRASYAVIGSGEPLLWIEGGPGYPAQLGLPDCELLAHRFNCYLVDSPGLGQSTRPADPRGYRYDEVVRFFDDVRAALGVDRWTLMGHSWGGLIALAYAAAAPESVTRVIVVDGYAGDASVPPDVAAAATERALARHADRDWFPAATSDGFELTEHTTTADLMADMWDRYPLYFAHPDRPSQQAHIARLRRDGALDADFQRAWNLGGYAAHVDLTSRLPDISCPTLVLVGAHDWVCGPVWAEVIVEHTPNARRHVFEESGHCPQYEEPDAFVAVIEDWLTANE